MEFNYRKSGYSSAGVSFSHLTESRADSTSRPKLPSIKVLNKDSIKEIIVSANDV